MDHQKEMCNETLETILVCSKPSNNNQINNLQEQLKKPRPQPEQSLKCPRCESTNTKFCYYNNYSLSQPRYLCKSCRRYWTKGGTLRNVPVGGGCRKNKRLSSSSSSSPSCNNNNNNPFKNKSFFEDQPLNNPLITGLPSMGYEAVDLNLAFASLQKQSSSAAASAVSQSSMGGKLGLGFGGDLSIFGNSTNAHCDTFGNSSNTVNGVGLFGTQNGNFNNLCTYGFMMGSDDHHYHHHHHNKSSSSTATVVPFEGSNKQELSISGNNSAGNSNKVLWGFPWQMNAESGTGGSEMDTGRECWNGLASSWHGLLNSPLM